MTFIFGACTQRTNAYTYTLIVIYVTAARGNNNNGNGRQENISVPEETIV